MMKYGRNARVGSLRVFSPEGARMAYAIFCKRFDGSMEASVACGRAAEDMHELGFSWEEIEAIELAAM